jgi:hypothetical protein
MPRANKIVMTEPQKKAVGQVMADYFGANFQTGRYAGHDGWVYVAWQFGPNWPVHFAYINPEGIVTHG